MHTHKTLCALLLPSLLLLTACGRSEPTSKTLDAHSLTAVPDPASASGTTSGGTSGGTSGVKLAKFNQLTFRQVSTSGSTAYAVADDGSIWWLTDGYARRVQELDPRLTTLDPSSPLPSPGNFRGAMPGSDNSTTPSSPSDTNPILPVNQPYAPSRANASTTSAVARPAKKIIKKKKAPAKKNAAKAASAAKKSTKKQV